MNPKLRNNDYLYYIINKTNQHNTDNISRTKAYQNFYMEFKEIKWAFIASMVSRNAGWNMTDLFLSPFQEILSGDQNKQLFMTYERANWLIFSDAYPQLLVYKLSIQLNRSMFHLLPNLHVSQFMVQEWNNYWKNNDKERLMIALIVNEQNVIQKPVIQQSYFKYHIFLRLPYLLQDFLFMNAIILPTRKNVLYGTFVHDFTNLSKRIDLGKRISSIMFKPLIYDRLLEYAQSIEHTGSRWDYEQFLGKQFEKGPLLRTVYPVITHQDIIRSDWYKRGGIKKKWMESSKDDLNSDVSQSFYKRRELLYAYYHLRNI
ncbi:DUF2515 family protein [Virgibacillus salinus]|uniref:DUF2515 domain-containing protein n=1 Tax=Virgibacillus salinus TaxID=553311 RepID=A0A1H1BTR6_9BACI|nr:DUF2515 family protein [Virgibacillus salinus]SDQ55289.1 Protein of unknown function [Virgibacillus salinus]